MNRIASFLLFIWACLLSAGIALADAAKDYNLGSEAYEAKQYEKALRHYLAACDAKLPEACYMAAGIYSQGQGVPANPDKAFHYVRLACEGGHAAACFNVAVLYMRAEGVKEDGREAFRYFSRACELNNADGCFNVGMAYENRVGVTYKEDDPEKKRAAFLKACDLKHGEACLKAYLPGTNNEGVEAELARRSCDYGHGDGCDRLAGMYFMGEHVEKDIRRAFELRERGCELGSGKACGWLAWRYLDGEGIKRDGDRALNFYRKACTLGQAEDCLRLGKFYEKGKHVKADPAEAVGFYKRACELEWSFDEGCYNLARHLVEGKVVERDMPLAIKLFDGACWSGDLPWACNELGLLYLNGNGVAKDLDQAGNYFNEACNLEEWKRAHSGYHEGCRNEKRLKRERDKTPDSFFTFE